MDGAFFLYIRRLVTEPWTKHVQPHPTRQDITAANYENMQQLLLDSSQVE